jgi:hypothetical protein
VPKKTGRLSGWSQAPSKCLPALWACYQQIRALATLLSDITDQVEVTVERDDQQSDRPVQPRALPASTGTDWWAERLIAGRKIRNVPGSSGRHRWTEHATLVQLGEALEPARPVQRGGLDVGLDVGLDGADPAGGLSPAGAWGCGPWPSGRCAVLMSAGSYGQRLDAGELNRTGLHSASGLVGSHVEVSRIPALSAAIGHFE